MSVIIACENSKCYLYNIICIDVNIRIVYDEFYPQLVSSLPMKDAIFVSHLVKLLPGDRKGEVKSKPTEAEAATCFLDKEITPAVESGDIESFTILLSVMESYGGLHVKKLAKQIKQEIEKIAIQRNELRTGKNMLFIAIATTEH